MFYRGKWLKRNGRLYCPWKAIIDDDHVRSIRENLCSISDDLLDVIKSNSKNIKHRISLRLSAHLLYGTCLIFKRRVNELYEDCLDFSYISKSIPQVREAVFNRLAIEENEVIEIDSCAETLNQKSAESTMSSPDLETLFEDKIDNLTQINELVLRDLNSNSMITNSLLTLSIHNNSNNAIASTVIPWHKRSTSMAPFTINMTHALFMEGSELEEIEPSKNKKRQNKTPPKIDCYKSFLSEYVRSLTTVIRSELRCNNPQDDILNLRPLFTQAASLMKEMAGYDRNINKKLQERFKRNIHVQERSFDDRIFMPDISGKSEQVCRLELSPSFSIPQSSARSELHFSSPLPLPPTTDTSALQMVAPPIFHDQSYNENLSEYSLSVHIPNNQYVTVRKVKQWRLSNENNLSESMNYDTIVPWTSTPEFNFSNKMNKTLSETRSETLLSDVEMHSSVHILYEEQINDLKTLKVICGDIGQHTHLLEVYPQESSVRHVCNDVNTMPKKLSTFYPRKQCKSEAGVWWRLQRLWRSGAHSVGPHQLISPGQPLSRKNLASVFSSLIELRRKHLVKIIKDSEQNILEIRRGQRSRLPNASYSM